MRSQHATTPSSVPSAGLIAAVVATLDGDDPEQCLTAALEVLRSHGLGEPPGARPAWLELHGADRSIVLATASGVRVPDLTTQAQLRQLLRVALRHVADDRELRRMRERMELLYAASFEGVMLHVDGVPIDVNQRWCELFGCTREEALLPDSMDRRVAPEDLEQCRARIRDRVEGEFLMTGIRKDGTRFRAEFCTKQTRLGDRPVRVVALRDVTARERTAELLRESESRLRRIFEAAFDCVVTNRDGIFVDVSRGAEALFGCPPAQLIGRQVLDFVAPSARGEVLQRIEEQIAGAYETTARTAQGEPVPVAVVSVSSTLDGEPVRVAALRDLRPARRLEQERRRLELQVERSQRLESLGALAGGIAHDFNNLLVGILGGAELLLDSTGDPTQRANAEAIFKAGRQAASLTKQMLAYAGRRDLSTISDVDLAVLWRELRELLDAALSKKARVLFDLAADSVVSGERASLSQVLMNLLTNASDALEGKAGTIHVSTRHVHEPAARWDDALGATVGPGDWVLIEVSDTGGGMSDSTRSRIFEPFFTTKPRGHGLGLGACLSIIKAHGGAILVESTKGQGSTFSVLLPAARRDVQPQVSSRSSEVEPCRVLIIDDEPLVRAHLRRLLELRGFAVEEASGGEAGLQALAARPVDVVLLDLTMPDLDGFEVARRLRATGSRVPIILCSGNLGQSDDDGVEADMLQATLEKPFSIDELMEAIERARRWDRHT